jgi:O-antigen/teichoic acid export membrane protein
VTAATPRLARPTLTLLTGNVGSAILGFGLSILIGRALGETGLGEYAAVLAWVYPLALAADFGLGTLITRDVAQQPEQAGAYLHTTTVARLMLGGSLALLLALSALLLDDAILRDGLLLAAPLVVINPFYGAFTAVFRAHQRMWPITALNIGMLAVQVPLVALAFGLGGSVRMALAINTLTSAGQLVAAWWFYQRLTSPGHSVKTTGPDARLLLRRAYPFAIAAVLAAVQTRAGLVLLERGSGAAEAGYYAASARIIDGIRMVPNAYFGALLPALAAMALDPAGMQRLFRRSALRLAGFGAAVALVLAPLAGIVLGLAYGDSFEAGATALALLAAGLIPGLVRSGQTLYWYARKQEAFVNRVTAGTLILQIGLMLWLIPRHGAGGAALALLLAESAAALCLWRLAPER